MKKLNDYLISKGWEVGGYHGRKQWYKDPQGIRGWYDEKMAVFVQKQRDGVTQ